jgi:hypothetical protein
VTANRTRNPTLTVCTLVLVAVVSSHVGTASAQAQFDVYTDLGGFIIATDALSEIDFENLADAASSDPDDVHADEFIPSSLILHGVRFADPHVLQTGFCSSATCQPDPDNLSGGNVVLFLNEGATVTLPVGTGGALFVIEGMGSVTFTLQVTDWTGGSARVDGQAVLDDVAYLGFTSENGIQQIEVVRVGSSGGPLVLSAMLVELLDPDVTIGVWADPAGDGGPADGDIVFGSATIQGDVVDLRVQFLAPPFSNCQKATGSSWCQEVTWCLNVDQDTATGSACGYTGADVALALSGEMGSLFGGPFTLDGTSVGLDPCSVGWYDWDSNTLRLIIPRSALSGDGALDYVVEGAFTQKDASNTIQTYTDTAPDSVDLQVDGGFFSAIEAELAPSWGMPLCSPYKEAGVSIQASGTVELFPELGTFRRAPIGNMVQSTYSKTTDVNRRFRRGFVELTVPELPDGVVVSHAALILPESRARISAPEPPVTHEVSYYDSADLIVDVDDYDRATTPVSQTFESDVNMPPETFSVDVTDVFGSDHEGEAVGFRVKLAVDPTYTAVENFGTSFDPYSDIPPRVLLRLSEAGTDLDPETGGTLIYTDTQGAGVIVSAPTGTVSQTTRLSYERGVTTTVAFSTLLRGMGGSGPSTFLVQVRDDFVLGAYQNGSPRSGSILQEPITVTVRYTDADVAGVNVDTLVLSHWDGSEWAYAACGLYDRHPDENWLSVPTCHLGSRFALFALPAEPYRAYLPAIVRQ